MTDTDPDRDGWSCPECGAGWESVIDLEARLSDTGYAHRDNFEKCGECFAEWTRGEPQGESGVTHECPICGDRLLFHKFDPQNLSHVHWKCPTCFYVPDDEPLVELNNGELATGYAAITGELVDTRGEWLAEQ